jgi:exopolysaccharide production protein ExoZ
MMGWIADQFELSRGEPDQNSLPMEGLRGFAVFLVFLVHYSTLIGAWITPQSCLGYLSDAIHRMGNAGVDLFFVLSGYLIYGSLITKKKDFIPFLRKRIGRIYPAFCIVFVIYLCLSFYFPKESKIPAGSNDAWIYVLQNFLLLPGLFPIEPMITVAWSLSYEMFYYLLIPAAIMLFRLRERAAHWRVMFFLLLAAMFAVYCAIWNGPARLIMFIAGILLHETLRAKALSAPRNGYAMLALFAGLMATMIPFPGPAVFTVKSILLAASFFTVCYCCFNQSDNGLARAFGWTPLRWLGNMSYSYYLLHGLALKIGFRLLHDAIPAVSQESVFFLAMLLPMFMVTLIPTIALFILIERPFSLAKQEGQVGGHRNIQKAA